MSIYSKELFTGPVAGATSPTATTPAPTPQAAESTACSSNDASSCVNAAVAMTMIKGYIAFRAHNRTLTNLNEALDFISTVTKDMIDNGDLTACQLENIKSWVKEKSSMFVNTECCCKHKLMHKVLENCAFTCTGSTACGADSTLGKLFAAHDAMHKAEREALDELGPSIQNAITQFKNRYGKVFDESYLKDWN